LVARWGWRGAFLLLGVVGFAWIGLWVRFYPKKSPTGNNVTQSISLAESTDRSIPWLDLLRHRQTWAYIGGTMASAPIWWFYIFWTPDFFNKRYGLNLSQSSLPLMCIFLVAGLGGIGGGWLSSFLLHCGWTLNAARKTAFLVCGLSAVPVFLTPLAHNYVVDVVLVSLAAAGHCGYAANLYALAGDTVPPKVVASVVGIGGM